MQLANKLGIQNRVNFLGEISDELRNAVYHAIDVYVQPSISNAESFGISLLEAMACGRAVVATRLIGASELIIDGFNGILVEPNDLPELIRALSSLREENLRKKMGNNAKVRVHHEYDVQANCYRLQKLYMSIR
jgi:glycosyltransferase involved in cell wall biosynthesis